MMYLEFMNFVCVLPITRQKHQITCELIKKQDELIIFAI